MDSILVSRITAAIRYSAFQRPLWDMINFWQELICGFEARISWPPCVSKQAGGQQPNDKWDYVVKHMKI